MNVIIDTDRSCNYEYNNVLRKLFNSVFIPVLHVLPIGAKSLVQKSHRSVKEVVDNATSHKALELLYNKGHKHHTVNFYHRFSKWVWFGMNNSKAVRNRMYFVKKQIKLSILRLMNRQNEVRILSIASGSARTIIEAISELYSVDSKATIVVTFLDKNPHALEYSKDLATKFNVNSKENIKMSWINGTVSSFLKNVNGQSFDIIEMVGLLDYFNNEKAVEVFRLIKGILNKTGLFITANIDHNSEEKFLTRVVGWNMIYRSAKELGSLLLEAGFLEQEIQLYYEPLKIHDIAVIIKK